MGDLTKNFSKSEFACKCKANPCGTDNISMELVNKLQLVRDEYGHTIAINSGCRCRYHNASIGSKETSSHIASADKEGEASDLKCENSVDRFKLLSILFKHFERIGVRKDFIHVDIDLSKDQKVFWVY